MGRFKDLAIQLMNEQMNESSDLETEIASESDEGEENEEAHYFQHHDPYGYMCVEEEEDEDEKPEDEPDPNSDCDSDIAGNEEVEIWGPCPSGRDREVVIAIVPKSVLRENERVLKNYHLWEAEKLADIKNKN